MTSASRGERRVERRGREGWRGEIVSAGGEAMVEGEESKCKGGEESGRDSRKQDGVVVTGRVRKGGGESQWCPISSLFLPFILF